MPRTLFWVMTSAAFVGAVVIGRSRLAPELIDRGTTNVFEVRSPRSEGESRRSAGTPTFAWRQSLTDFGLQSVPRHLIAVQGVLVMVSGAGDILAMSPSDRQIHWRRPSSELRVTARVLIAFRDSLLVVLGTDDDRPVVLHLRTGARLDVTPPVADPQLTLAGCGLRQHVLSSTLDRVGTLVLSDTLGRIRRRTELPWDYLRDAHGLQRQLLLAGNSEGTCVAALAVANGIAKYDSHGLVWARWFVESFRTPAVTERTSSRNGTVVREAALASHAVAARDITTMNGLVFVAFAGNSELAGQLVDIYDATDGRYLGTCRFPFIVRRIAAANGVLYVVAYIKGVPTLHAYVVADLNSLKHQR